MAKAKKAVDKVAETNENEILIDEDFKGNRYLPGAEEAIDKDIAAAAGHYHALKTDRVALLAKELDAKEQLIDVCHAKKDLFVADPDNTGAKIYRVRDLLIRIKNEWTEKITTEIIKG